MISPLLATSCIISRLFIFFSQLSLVHNRQPAHIAPRIPDWRLLNRNTMALNMKRKQTLETKVKLLKEVDKKRKQADICEKFKIPRSTLSTITKNWSKIEEASSSAKFTDDRKRFPAAADKYNHLYEALLMWFKQARAMQVPLSGPILMEKAMSINGTSLVKWIPFNANSF